MKYALTAIALALGVSPVAYAQLATPSPSVESSDAQMIEGIIAIVNDQPISYSDVRERASLLLLTLGVQQPNQQQVQQITSQALDELIEEKLKLQEAAEYEVEVSDEDVARSVGDMARQSGLDREGLINVLLSSGVNPASLEAQMRADIAWQRIMGGLYGSRIRISENQIEDRLNQLKASAQTTQYNISEIFLYTATEEEKQQAIAGANTILEQLRAGAPFQLAAERFSSAPTAASGGSMGFVSLDAVEPAVAEAVKAMDEPGLSEPIVVDDGVYIISYQGKREPSETVTVLDLLRLSVSNGSEEDLLAARAAAEDCEGARQVAENDPNLTAAEIEDVRITDLGPEARSTIGTTEVGQSTDVFATSGTIAVMYVCGRDENGNDLPTREEIEDQLFSRELSMISQRSLRNLRREATIIQRGS